MKHGRTYAPVRLPGPSPTRVQWERGLGIVRGREVSNPRL